MCMTVDGTGDDLIQLQGLDNYSFCDADGGELGEVSDEEDEEILADVDEGEEGGDAEMDSSDDEEFEDGELELDSSDDEDDTAEPGVVRTTIGDAVAPAGYKVVDSCPAVATAADRQDLIGKLALVGWDKDGLHGWYIGTIHSTHLNARDLGKTPSANFVIKYSSQRTAGAINGLVACELSERTHGSTNWWVLAEKL